jgi:hypothetical protein
MAVRVLLEIMPKIDKMNKRQRKMSASLIYCGASDKTGKMMKLVS